MLSFDGKYSNVLQKMDNAGEQKFIYSHSERVFFFSVSFADLAFEEVT